MARHGFEPELAPERRRRSTSCSSRCPFATTALADPDVVCDLHLGLAMGAAEGLGGIVVDEARPQRPEASAAATSAAASSQDASRALILTPVGDADGRILTRSPTRRRAVPCPKSGTRAPTRAAGMPARLVHIVREADPGLGRRRSSCSSGARGIGLHAPSRAPPDRRRNHPGTRTPGTVRRRRTSPHWSTSAVAARSGPSARGGDHRRWSSCPGKGNGAEDWSLDPRPRRPGAPRPRRRVRRPGAAPPQRRAVLPSVARTTGSAPTTGPTSASTGEVTTPGPSPTPSTSTSSDLHALLAAIGETGPVVLAAHSYSGLVATLYARTHPDDVAGLVMVDTVSEVLEQLVTPGALD